MEVTLENWNALQHIDEVEQLNASDESVFEAIRAVLKEHGVSHRFGVKLLHKHFELQDDEVLVETCDEEARTLSIQPVRRSQLSDAETMQTMWSFTADRVQASAACKRMCYIDEDRIHEDKHWP